MSDEIWLRELAQVNREQHEDEQDRLDGRWDRLSRGELSPDEEAELRALAGTSEEAHAAWEAFRPLGPEFHASVVQKVRKQGLEKSKKLLPFRRRIAGWSAVAALAAAASVMLVLRPLAPLPDYSLEVTGVSASRGDEPETAPVLVPGNRFEVTVRPATEVARGSKLEAYCVLAQDRELRPLEVRSEIVPAGLVRMTGSLGHDVPPGAWTLWAVVGRPGKLPDPAASTFSTGARVRQRDWVAVPKDIRIQDQPP